MVSNAPGTPDNIEAQVDLGLANRTAIVALIAAMAKRQAQIDAMEKAAANDNNIINGRYIRYDAGS